MIVDEELAVAGVGGSISERAQDFDAEKPGALDADVEGIAGVLHAAFGEVELGVADAGAEADEDSGGGDIAVATGGAGGFLGLVEEVFEVDAAALEAVGFGVRQIVGDDVDSGGKPP